MHLDPGVWSDASAVRAHGHFVEHQTLHVDEGPDPIVVKFGQIELGLQIDVEPAGRAMLHAVVARYLRQRLD